MSGKTKGIDLLGVVVVVVVVLVVVVSGDKNLVESPARRVEAGVDEAAVDAAAAAAVAVEDILRPCDCSSSWLTPDAAGPAAAEAMAAVVEPLGA